MATEDRPVKLLALGVAISLAAAAGCDRRPTTPPSPKTDSVSQAQQAGAGSTTTPANAGNPTSARSEEHTSELQSRRDLVCRLLLEKKKRRRSKAKEGRARGRPGSGRKGSVVPASSAPTAASDRKRAEFSDTSTSPTTATSSLARRV